MVVKENRDRKKRYRIQINGKINEYALLTLTPTILPPLLLATTIRGGFAQNFFFY